MSRRRRRHIITSMSAPFHIAVTADFFDAAGKLMYRDIGLNVLEREPGLAWRAFSQHQPEIQPEQLAGVQAALVLAPRVTANSLQHSADLLTVARFGVGYDSVDVAACTAADV